MGIEVKLEDPVVESEPEVVVEPEPVVESEPEPVVEEPKPQPKKRGRKKKSEN